MTNDSYNIAIIGATGNVGRAMLDLLSERQNFPIGEVFAVASSRSAGTEVAFGDDKKLIVHALDAFDFSQVDIALSSPGASISKDFAPRAAADGCVVIDNTSYFRMHEDIPLVVPEVNPEALNGFRRRNIIANPNCSTIQMVVALKPLHDIVPIKRVVVSTYQSVSGAGKAAMDELYEQTKKRYTYNDVPAEQFTKQIAFNAIPHIDVFMDDGFTKEEWKMRVETKKIMGDEIELVANCVRLPVFVGHGEAINIEFADEISLEEAYEALEEAPGVVVVDRREDGGYMTPVECVGQDAVFVSRLRVDPSMKNALAMWVVSDNVRKGAALNTLQIAEELVQNYGL